MLIVLSHRVCIIVIHIFAPELPPATKPPATGDL